MVWAPVISIHDVMWEIRSVITNIQAKEKTHNQKI